MRTYDEYRRMTEQALVPMLESLGEIPEKLLEAMKYSLEAGGKRIRPVLLLAACALAFRLLRRRLTVRGAVRPAIRAGRRLAARRAASHRLLRDRGIAQVVGLRIAPRRKCRQASAFARLHGADRHGDAAAVDRRHLAVHRLRSRGFS